METLSDMALVIKVRVFHDKRAFEQLVVKYQSPLRRFFIVQTLGDEQLSDDLAQDTFIKAYVNINKFAGRSSFSTWLFKIAHNVFIDHTRNRRITTDIDAASTARQAENGSDIGMRMDLCKALACVSPIERSCITLQMTDGYKIEKISEITGLPTNTVKSHLSRGKAKMQNYLKQNGYDKQ